jgi:hypothetical protein
MPQIWMTYDEVADLLQCGTDGTLARIKDDRLDRKISHDGRKRVKLNLALTGMFLERVRTQFSVQPVAVADPLDLAIDDLRKMHGQMADYGAHEDLLFDPEKPARKTTVAA